VSVLNTPRSLPADDVLNYKAQVQRGSRKSYPMVDDHELMRRIARQDQSALTELYQSYAPLIYGIAMRVLQNSVWAEETMQDTFIKVWREPGKWNPDAGRLVSWLVTVARYTAIDRLRKERRQPPLNFASLDEMPHLAATSGGIDDLLWVDTQLLRGFMDQLPPPQQQVIQLAFWQGMTHMEISAHLGLPLGTVKSRLQLGLHKLREMVHEGSKSVTKSS
jgi:RNA polymerase sigma-70 factor, ECF subfamily